MTTDDFLECQDCGDLIAFLTPAEAQQVARQPQNFIQYCRRCLMAQERENAALRSGKVAP